MRKFSAHLGYLFAELPLEERFRAAKRFGFGGVEHPGPYLAPAINIARWLREVELPFVQMALPAGDAGRGEKGIAALPERIDAFRDSIPRGLDYAQRIGCTAVHAMSGVRPQDISFEQLWDIYIENMAVAAGAASERGLILLIEPIGSGTLPDYFMDEPALAVRAIREIGLDNVRLIFDAFHAANGNVDPAAFVRENGQLIHHMHIADYPGRHEPGTGTIDFEALYAALDDTGYRGFIGCEYIPLASTEEGLSWLSEHSQSHSG